MEPPPTGWQLPDPAVLAADVDGHDLVGLGADLAPGTLLLAYRTGLFPMYVENSLGWWSPDPRGVLPLDCLRVSRSLRASMNRYVVTVNRAFSDVVKACASQPRDGSWISDDFIASYCDLHRLGWAHSVEVWTGTPTRSELVGGLYGVGVGGLFAGESMFHTRTDASKAALVALVETLRSDGLPRLLDVQWRTPHLGSLGAVEVSRRRYLGLLGEAIRLPPAKALWPGQ